MLTATITDQDESEVFSLTGLHSQGHFSVSVGGGGAEKIEFKSTQFKLLKLISLESRIIADFAARSQ